MIPRTQFGLLTVKDPKQAHISCHSFVLPSLWNYASRRIVSRFSCDSFTMTDPGGRGDRILAVFIFFLVLCTIACALRAFTRIKIQKAFGWDDRLALLAWVYLMLCN